MHLNQIDKKPVEYVEYLGWVVADGESVVIATVFTNTPLSPKDIHTALQYGMVRVRDLDKRDGDTLTVGDLRTPAYLLEVLEHCPEIVDVFFHQVRCVPGWKWDAPMVEVPVDC